MGQAGRLANLGHDRLGWAGLGWAGLGWAGLGWARLGTRCHSQLLKGGEETVGGQGFRQRPRQVREECDGQRLHLLEPRCPARWHAIRRNRVAGGGRVSLGLPPGCGGDARDGHI